MDILQVFTGRLPFHNLVRNERVILSVMTGERPGRPPEPAKQLGLDDEIWNLMQDGWAHSPCNRPNIGNFLKLLTIV
jgi:hypothetical protein